MWYIIITLINFSIIFFCSHFLLWNENTNDYWNKEKRYTRFAPPVWVWIIIFITGLTYWMGLIICLVILMIICIDSIVDHDIIIDPRLSEWFKRTWIGKFLSFIIRILNKNVSL